MNGDRYGSRGFAEMSGNGADAWDSTRIQMSQPSEVPIAPNSRPPADPSLGRARYGAVAPLAIEATAPQQTRQPGANGGIDPASGQPLKPWAPRPDQLQVPPRVPGSDIGTRPGSLGSSDPGIGHPAAVTDQQRRELNAAMEKHFSVFNQLAAGATGGLLGSGPIPYALDRLAVTVPAAGRVLENLPVLNYKGHSPLQMQVEALENHKLLFQTQRQQYADRIGGLNETVAAAGQVRADIAAAAGQPELDLPTGTARIDRLINEAGLKAGRTKNGDVADAWMKRQNFLQEAKSTGYTTAQGVDLTDVGELQKLTTAARAKAPSTERILFPEDVQVLQQMRANAQMHQATEQIGAINKSIATVDKNLATIDGSISHMVKTGESGFGVFGTGKGVTVEVGVAADGLTPITKEIAAWKEPVAAEAGWAKPLGRVAGKWNGDQWTSKIGEGVMVAGASMATSMALDNLFQGHPSKNLGTELPFVLGALMVPNLSPKQRIAATAAATASGWAIDHFAPIAPDSTLSKIMAPNWVDGIATSAAWMLPFKSVEGRIGAVALGYALGRAADVVENFTPLHIPGMEKLDSTRQMNNALTDALRAAEGAMNHQHFMDIVNRGKTLGLENEGVVMAQYSDFMNIHHGDANPMAGLYGSAAISTAIADTFLQRGTAINPDVNKDAQSNDYRILSAMNLDLTAPLPPRGLGDATTFYRGAANNLIQAEQYAINNHAPQAQVDDIKQSLKYVEDKLNVIYGPHDMQAAYEQLKNVVRDHISDGLIPHFKVAMKARVDAAPANDRRYAAKLCRDLALLDLAIAGYQSQTHNNGGDAAQSYQEAQRYLRVAEQLEGSNANNPQLQAIVRQLSGTVSGAMDKQLNSPLNSPFGQR